MLKAISEFGLALWPTCLWILWKFKVFQKNENFNPYKSVQKIWSYHSRKSKCQCALGNFFLRWKYLLGWVYMRKNWIGQKKTLGALPYGRKVKSDFSVYFSIEKNYSKKMLCIINLVQWQVYRVEKVGKYLLSLSSASNERSFGTATLNAYKF